MKPLNNRICCKTAPLKVLHFGLVSHINLHLDTRAGYLNVRGLIQKARGVAQRQSKKVKWVKSMATLPLSRALSITRSPSRMNPGNVTKK